MKRRRIVLGVLSMGYGKLVTAVSQLLMVPVLASTWGVEVYGQWLLLSAIPVFLAASDFGFGTAAGNRLIGEVARGHFDDAVTTFQSALAVILTASLVMLGAVLATGAMLPDGWLDSAKGMTAAEARPVLMILGTYGLLAMQGSIFMAVTRSEGAFARSTLFEATVQLAEAGAVIAAALAGHSPFVAAAAYLAVRSCGIIGHIGLARYHARWLRIGFGRVQRERVRSLFRPAIAAMMLPLATAGFLQGTAIAVGVVAGPAAVPVYTSLRTLSRVALQLLMTVNLPILPEFTSEFARGNREWVARITGGLTSFNAAAGLFGALGLALFGEWILAVWTRGAIVAPPAMLWLTALAMAASTTWNPLSSLLVAINHHERFTYAFIVAATTTIALTYAAAQYAGVVGAAGANLCLDLFMLIFVFRMTRKTIGKFPLGWKAMTVLLPARLQK